METKVSHFLHWKKQEVLLLKNPCTKTRTPKNLKHSKETVEKLLLHKQIEHLNKNVGNYINSSFDLQLLGKISIKYPKGIWHYAKGKYSAKLIKYCPVEA